MPTVCVASLRQRVHYSAPLRHDLDFYHYLLNGYIKNHEEIDWAFYNVSYGPRLPFKRTGEIARADVIVVPSHGEALRLVDRWRWGLRDVVRNDEIRSLTPLVAGKRLIVLRDDVAEGEWLYRNRVFCNLECDFKSISGHEFPLGVSALRWHFIRKELFSRGELFDGGRKRTAFGYWGAIREVDHLLRSTGYRVRALRRLDRKYPACLFIGEAPHRPADLPAGPAADLIDVMRGVRCTLCFEAAAVRRSGRVRLSGECTYHEAMACGVVPLAWHNFDPLSEMVPPVNRISDRKELLRRVRSFVDASARRAVFEAAVAAYRTHPVSAYEKRFDELLTPMLS